MWGSGPYLDGGVDTPGAAMGVAMSGSYAYVADYYGGLQIVDIATPTVPVKAANAATSGDARGVAVSGSYAYLAASRGGLQVADVRNLADSVITGRVDSPNDALGVAPFGSYAYVADARSLQAVDVTTPTAPAIAGHLSRTWKG